MNRIITVSMLMLFSVAMVPSYFAAKRWRKRWGTPIDKGNHPAKIPTGALTQARFSKEYAVVKTYEL